MQYVRALIRSDERGAAAVEFGLLAGLFFLIVFGIVEVGLLFRSEHSLEHAAAEASRRGSIAGPEPLADFLILEQLQEELADNGDSISRVIVYRAANPEDGPPAGCLSGGTSNVLDCNVYSAADLSRPSSDFGSCVIDGGWCPTDRNDSLTEPDMLGVWVEGLHTSSLGILNDRTLLHRSVVPLEPARR